MYGFFLHVNFMKLFLMFQKFTDEINMRIFVM